MFNYVAYFVVLSLLIPIVVSTNGYNINSFPMIMSNPQRNGMSANATALDRQTLTVAWTFLEPDADSFRDAPVYSADDHAVYAASYTGFIYSINSNNGTQNWEACIGDPPKFPGDPCANSGIDPLANFPYGQPSLLSNGNMIILRRPDGQYKEAMICLNKTDGSQLWSYQLPEYTTFPSAPTSIPQQTGGDIIIIWVSSYSRLSYTVINGTTGEEITAAHYPDHGLGIGSIAAMSVDPNDGTVISQWVDLVRHCPGAYACSGIAKFETLTGDRIWNQTMEESFTNGFVAINPTNNTVYVTSNQLDSYAYDLDSGNPLWKASTVTSTDDMGWASTCADGTVLIVDQMGGIVAFDPTPERVMKPKWGVAGDDPMSRGVTTLSDNTFVYSVGNVVIARDCGKSPTILWSEDFGDTDNGPGAIVAVSNDAVYANVYWPGKGSGMIVKITDARSNSTSNQA